MGNSLNIFYKNILYEKLKKLLENIDFQDEGSVVYLFVLMRKYIELKVIAKEFRIIKFYADWVLHTEKTHVPEYMQSILKNLINNKIPTLSSIYSMQEMGHEIQELLEIIIGKNAINISEAGLEILKQTLIKIIDEAPLQYYDKACKDRIILIHHAENNSLEYTINNRGGSFKGILNKT